MCNPYDWKQDAGMCCSQELESAWHKIDRQEEQEQAVLDMSKDIKSELGGFYEKVDVSSNLTSKDHQRYRLLFSHCLASGFSSQQLIFVNY